MYVPSRYHRRRPTEVTLADDPVDAQIERINELTRVGRANWFGLLAYLAFATVTLLGVEHADFFLDTRATTLPLIGVSIPTFSFFIFAPILGTALYVYLHLHIRKLGEAIAIPDPFPKQPGVPLERHLNSWLLVDTLLHFRRDGAIAQRNLDLLARLLTLLLVWAAGPAVLFLFWVISWPAHEEWLTLGLLALCILATWTGFNSWLETRRAIRNPQPMGRYLKYVSSLACLVTIGAAAHLGWVKTESGGVPRLAEGTLSFWQEIAPIDLRGLQAVNVPPEQLDYITARQTFRRDWCARQSLTMAQCGWHVDWEGQRPARVSAAREAWCDANEDEARDDCTDFFSALEERFRAEWRAFRSAQIAALNPPDLSGRDLRNADLSNAALLGMSFEGAELQGANLENSQLQSANLRDVQMQGAIARGASLQGAFMTNILMDRADLLRAQLQNASLSGARLNEAIMVDAHLQAASLVGADLQATDLRGAIMHGAQVGFAEMQEADLRQVKLQGADLRDALMQRVDLRGAQLQETDLQRALLAGADLQDVRLQGADLSFVEMQGAVAIGANMQRANLLGARLDGTELSFADLRTANLMRTWMQGANLRNADLRGANIAGAHMSEDTSLVDANMLAVAVTQVNETTESQLRPFWEDIFADGNVLPNDPIRPDHWATEELRSTLYGSTPSTSIRDSPFAQAWRAWAAEHHPDVPLAIN